VCRADGSSAQRQFSRPHFLAISARDPEMEMEHSPSCFVLARIRCSMTVLERFFMLLNIPTYQINSNKNRREKENPRNFSAQGKVIAEINPKNQLVLRCWGARPVQIKRRCGLEVGENPGYITSFADQPQHFIAGKKTVL